MKEFCGGALIFLYFFTLFLIIGNSISTVIYGWLLHASDCELPAWIFIIGITSTVGILFVVFLIPSFPSMFLNIEDRLVIKKTKLLSFSVVCVVWLVSGAVAFGEKDRNCTREIITVYGMTTGVTVCLYGILLWIAGIIDCLEFYQKDDRSVLEEPLIDDSKV